MSVHQTTLSPEAAALMSRLWDASCKATSARQLARLDRLMSYILASA